MKFNYRLILLFVLTIFFCCRTGSAQIKKDNIKLGFGYGVGAQNRFPFNKKDYSHDVTFYKFQINYRFKDKKKWAFELNFETSYNVVEHQLLNPFYIKPNDTDNYQELRELYTQKRTLKEYVLNGGIIVRYKIYKGISAYVISSLGPMFSDKSTERLERGFAFSDILGLGCSYELDKLQLGFRYSLRHTSNLGLKQPNFGHNTSNTEFYVLFKL